MRSAVDAESSIGEKCIYLMSIAHVGDHKPHDKLHEHKEVGKCISKREDSLTIIDAARAQSLLSISSYPVNSLMQKRDLAEDSFQTPNGTLRAAGRSRTPHRDRHRAHCV